MIFAKGIQFIPSLDTYTESIMAPARLSYLYQVYTIV